MEGDGVWACVQPGPGEFFTHIDDVFTRVFGDGLGVGVWCAGFRGDRFRPTGVEVGQDLVDALAGDPESFGDFGSGFALISYSFNDCEVAVGAVHFVNDVPTDPGLALRHAVAGRCQLCRG